MSTDPQDHKLPDVQISHSDLTTSSRQKMVNILLFEDTVWDVQLMRRALAVAALPCTIVKFVWYTIMRKVNISTKMRSGAIRSISGMQEPIFHQYPLVSIPKKRHGFLEISCKRVG